MKFRVGERSVQCKLQINNTNFYFGGGERQSTERTWGYFPVAPKEVFTIPISHADAMPPNSSPMQVVYNALAKCLVEEKGYDKSLLQPFDRDFW